jgi:outer membrane protein insertion porin family
LIPALCAWLLGTNLLLYHRVAWAEAPNRDAEPTPAAIPTLRPAPALGRLAGRPVVRIEVVTTGGRWAEQAPALRRARVGEPLTIELAERALGELADSGRYANVRAEVEPLRDGVLLRLVVIPRRLVARVTVSGGALDEDDTVRAAAIRQGSELTASELPAIAERVRSFYASHGYPEAAVNAQALDTDDPLHVVLVLGVHPGHPQRIEVRRFLISPDPNLASLKDLVFTYRASKSKRVDEDDLGQADRELEQRLRARGWFRAAVSHVLERDARGRTKLRVDVDAGPLVRPVFEGNAHFDATQLEAALGLEESDDRSATILDERLRDFYRRRGFLDVEVTSAERGGPADAVHDLVFELREGAPVRVRTRIYPCLTGGRRSKDVSSEIDSFLSEELPGSGLFSAVDPKLVDQSLGQRQFSGARVDPYQPNPWRTYVPDVYEKALKHVQELFRSEGYLSAVVGPAQLIRRRCHPRSPPGECRPIGPRRDLGASCRYDELGLPVEEPVLKSAVVCQPDPAKGVRCEPDVQLVIPIKLGPRTELWGTEFEGNRVVLESELGELAELELGSPASQVELERARRRVLDAYAERGFAFATVETGFEFSRDRTRARARFVISEGEQVRVADIVVRGAQRTNERLILSRVALKRGDLYRHSDVRASEERLATLGVFSSVSVALEDPSVPAREKVVVITVQERPAQYLDNTAGFSSGEGVRVGFEYGHRNLGGEAIPLKLRVHLGYLPDFLILEPDVRAKFGQLGVGDRLERRLTASVEFPDIGLGPLFRLVVEGVDARHNARDYGLTKDAGIVTLVFRPSRRLSAQIGGSVERNIAEIFGATTTSDINALADYVSSHQNLALLFRVPQGTTRVLAERIGATWDRTDNPLAATRGTLISATVEHVNAVPVGHAGGSGVFEAIQSDFLRISNRVAGYVRLSEAGLAWATELRWGRDVQLRQGSRTYPDRLFFLGGMESIRGYLQDSFVPEEIARQLLNPNSGLTLNKVLIRGGDLFVNPRTELRIPLGGSVQTALFVDAGNLWTRPGALDPVGLTNLRYTAGSGLRLATPIGPLVFDYGFNLSRVADRLYPHRSHQRYWEDLGAFHFSIGTF